MMDNGKMPAMPIEIDGHGQYAPEAHTGLTKREDFTKTFIAASISAGNTYEGFIDDAIMWAEEALAKLDETKS